MSYVQKYSKLILSLVIAIVTMFTTVNGVSAATYPSSLTNVKTNEIINYNGYDSMYYKTSENYKVFCTTFHIPYVGTKCSLSSSQWTTPVQAGVAAIINRYNTNQTKQNYYYSELAINEFLYYYSSGSNVNRISSTRNVRATAGVKDFYNAAVSAYDEAKKTYSISLKTNGDSIKFSESGNYYVSEKITVTPNSGNVSSYKVTLSGVNGAEVYNKSGNSFYVRIPKSKISIGSSVTVKVAVTAIKNIDIAKKFDCGSSYQNLTPNITTTTSVNADASKTGKITIKGNTVKINKIDSETKKAVAGATLIVKNSKGSVIKTWVTDGKTLELKNLEAGTYTVAETKAPNGYVVNNKAVSFKVAYDDKTVIVSFENTKTKNPLEISKTDATNGKELPGATLILKKVDGTKVDEWVSGTEVHRIANVEAGEYELTEISSPDGYRLSKETVRFTVKGDGTTTKVEMKNAPMNPTVVNIIKIDSKTKEALKGATLVVKDAKGNVKDEWVTDGKTHELKNLEVGTYTLTETKAPNGYVLNKQALTFKVAKDDKTITVKMLNTKNVNPLEISKTDATNGKELPGATLILKKVDGTKVDEWVSGTEVHRIANVEAGEYELTEISSPDGYRLSKETVRFTVKGDGTTTKVEMKNAPMNPTVVNIIKIDSETKEALKGATLVVKDAKGNVKDEWVTDGKTHELKNLEVGTYTLTETKAPNGYVLNKQPLTFKVAKDDKTITVTMENSKEVVNPLEISKQDATNGKELPGATLILKKADGTVVDKWVSGTEVHRIANVEAGEYELTEISSPDGYKLSEETVRFTVKGDGTTTKVVMYNSKEDIPTPPPAPDVPNNHNYKVEISKQDVTTKEELPGATLVVKDAKGNEIARWVSGSTPYYLYLAEGDYTLTEIQAPNGYDLSYEVVKFTVTNKAELQKVVMYNSKTPDTGDKNISFIIGMMVLAISGIGVSALKLR